MANIKSAIKRAKQNEVRRQHNASMRSKFRTVIKRVVAAIQGKDKEAAQSAYKTAVPVIDSMVNKKIIKKNKAARHKSRLNAQIKALNEAQS